MKKFGKFIAAATAFSLAATMASCSAPAIGSGSATAITIDGYDVPAGVFIYYTISAYYEAQQILYEQNNKVPTMDDVKNAHIDNIEAGEWIQDKASDYCSMFVAVEKEFEKINGTISADDMAEVEDRMAVYDTQSIYSDNGISEDSLRKIFLSDKKNDAIFDYYFGFDGSKGCSEDELKEYFDENFARVKYVKLSTLDTDGEKMDDDAKHKLKQKAEAYAKEVNEESGVLDKMYKMDDVKEDYNEYVEELKAEASTTAEGEETTEAETTTTAVETTDAPETTTTDPYANEQIIMRVTTASADENEIVITTEAETTSAQTDTLANLKNFIFGDLGLNTAKVLEDYDNDAIYVVIRADLKERLTDDDLWGENYIESLQSLRYSDSYTKYIENISKDLSADRNKSAYRRYSPFKLNYGS